MKCFAAQAVILIVAAVGLAFALIYGLEKESRYYTIDQQEFYSNGVTYKRVD